MTDDDAPADGWGRGGRSVRWRLLMLAAGALVAGYGVLVLVEPRVLVWTIAGCTFAVGAVLALSALIARGPKPPAD